MQAGDTQAVWGTLLLEHNGREYEISRKQIYTSTGSGVHPSSMTADIVYLQPDGQTKTRIGSEFSSNIERILPFLLALSVHHLFDILPDVFDNRIAGILIDDVMRRTS